MALHRPLKLLHCQLKPNREMTVTQLRLHVGFHLIHEHFLRRPGLECSASAGLRRKNHYGEHCKHPLPEIIVIIFQVKNELKLNKVYWKSFFIPGITKRELISSQMEGKEVSVLVIFLTRTSRGDLENLESIQSW